MTFVVGSVPVEPDAPTARRWAEQELADAVYHQSRSLLERILDWLGRQFGDVQGALPSAEAVVLTLVAIGLVVAIAFAVTGPVRRNRRAQASGAVLDGDDRRTAARLRADADAAAAREDWPTAVVERFRAVVRALEERAVLDEQPGRTADEAAAAAGGRLPSVADRLAHAAALFDAVAYGDRAASSEDDAALRDLDRLVAGARRTVPSPEPAEVPR